MVYCQSFYGIQCCVLITFIMKFRRNLTLRIGFILYISFASITSLFVIKGNTFFQFSEIVFLCILPFCYPLIKDVKLTRIDFLFILYCLIFLINCLFHFEETVLLESLGVFYLALLFFLLSRFLSTIEDFRVYLGKVFRGLILVSSLTALLGILFYEVGITDRFLVVYENYPYLGKIIKLTGFTWCNLLLSTLCVSSLFLTTLPIRKRTKIGFISIGILIAFFTFSKEFILFGVLLITLVLYQNNKSRDLKSLFPVLAVFLAIFMVTFSFYVVKPKNLSKEEMNLANMNGIGETAHFQAFNVDFYPTIYFFHLQGSLKLIRQNPIFGVGSGNFKKELDSLKELGFYPADMETRETHDLYWGKQQN